MAGRPRIPIEIKKLRGTLQKSRAPRHLVAVVEGVPEPPDWLSERAANIFREHWSFAVAAGVNSSIDVGMLTLLAVRLEEVQICTMLIEDLGRVISRKSATGPVIQVANPAIRQRNEAIKHCQSLLNEFGLSPAARVKVSANGPARKATDWTDF